MEDLYEKETDYNKLAVIALTSCYNYGMSLEEITAEYIDVLHYQFGQVWQLK